MTDLAERYQTIKAIIESASKSFNRPLLLAVSKVQPIKKMEFLHEFGINDFGESYLQEALIKIEHFKNKPINWHFIGPIQSNKTRLIAENFDWVHSVCSVKVAKRLSAQRPESMPSLNICLQVNIDNESTKAGKLPEEVSLFFDEIKALPNLSIRGLMCLPKKRENIVDTCESFNRLAKLKNSLCDKMDTLSMGMSSDLEYAISEGSTIVRVGTALFGTRGWVE